MQSASIGQFGNLDFVFLDLKQHSSSLDSQMLKDFKKIEKLIKNTLLSRKKIETDLLLVSPQLFSFRIKALDWLTEEKLNLDTVLDEVYPSIENLGQNPRLKKIAYHLAQALTDNRKLVSFFSETGALTENNFKSVSESNIDYETFIVALQFMPPRISRTFLGIMNASLQIEFVSIAAVMINNDEAKCSDFKISQLLSLASKASLEYMGYVNHLLTMAQTEMFMEEKADFNHLSLKAFANAYGNDEPDYESITLREPNPDYHK